MMTGRVLLACQLPNFCPLKKLVNKLVLDPQRAREHLFLPIIALVLLQDLLIFAASLFYLSLGLLPLNRCALIGSA